MSGWTLRNRFVPPIQFPPFSSINPPSPLHSPPHSFSSVHNPDMNQSEDPSTSPLQLPSQASTAEDMNARLTSLENAITALGTQLAGVSIPPPVATDIDPIVTVPEAVIPVRNPRFIQVLSTTTYRLVNQDSVLRPDQMSSLSTTAALLRPRLDGSYFSGDPPLGILPFLTQVARVANQSQISEATLLWVVDDFLRSPAKEAFRIQRHDTWNSAVQWFLSSYAPETGLESAVRKLHSSSQHDGESVRQFGLRIQSEASLLGSLITLSELKALFGQGISDPVRSLFAANQPMPELTDTVPLSVLIGRAELLEKGTNSFNRHLSSTSSGPRRSYPTVLAVTETEAEVKLFDREIDIMALEPYQRNSKYRGITCYVCFRTGHGWLDCPCLNHLSSAEKEDMAFRRRSFFDKRKSDESKSAWTNPGWDTAAGMVKPFGSGYKSPPSPETLLTRSGNGPRSPRN